MMHEPIHARTMFPRGMVTGRANQGTECTFLGIDIGEIDSDRGAAAGTLPNPARKTCRHDVDFNARHSL